MTDGILLEKRGAVGLVTLDRPRALNAFDQPMASALLRVLDDIAQDTGIRAVDKFVKAKQQESRDQSKECRTS